ncbi:hypothetical protein CHISP_2610 [Chitinispirillum alkaliphilum]|nr:hypothetical protein CHISP_2610 [Chitinispirillum alkaliphilum]
MNSKKIIISLGVIVVVALTIFVAERLSNQAPPDHKLRFFPGVTESSISGIHISEGENSVILTKDGNRWFVKSGDEEHKTESFENADSESPERFLADSASVQVVLEKIVNLRKNTLVSENPERQSSFEVDEESGVFVSMWDEREKSLGAFRIGKTAIDWNTHYVRQMGSNSVYSIAGGVRYPFFSEVNRWRDRRIMSFNRNDVLRINIDKQGEEEFTIEKVGQEWMITHPVSHVANIDTVASILATATTLRTSGFENELTDYDEMGLTEPELRFSVDLSDGTRREVIVGDENEKTQRWTKAEGRNDLFLISTFDFNRLNRGLENVKAAAAEVIESPDELM